MFDGGGIWGKSKGVKLWLRLMYSTDFSLSNMSLPSQIRNTFRSMSFQVVEKHDVAVCAIYTSNSYPLPLLKVEKRLWQNDALFNFSKEEVRITSCVQSVT